MNNVKEKRLFLDLFLLFIGFFITVFGLYLTAYEKYYNASLVKEGEQIEIVLANIERDSQYQVASKVGDRNPEVRIAKIN